MNTPRLNLVVLRVVDIDRAAAFYRVLGFEFLKHAHGSGPEHYACETDGFVFELYPSSAEQPVSTSARIGFAVADVDGAVAKLAAVAARRSSRRRRIRSGDAARSSPIPMGIAWSW